MMADDWSNLADDFEDDDAILIGKIDCTKVINQQLCADYGVTGYPTLLYGDVSDLKEYNGQRELGDMRDVVEEYLEEPICGVTRPDLCKPKQKKAIEDLVELGLEQLDQDIKEYEETVAKMEAEKDEFVKDLRKKYSDEQKRKDFDKKVLEESSNIGLMKLVLQMKKSGKIPKDESHDEL